MYKVITGYRNGLEMCSSTYANTTTAYFSILHWDMGPVAISDKTSYRKISWSIDAAKFVFIIVRSLWNLTCTSTALPPTCLSNFTAIRSFKLPISRLRDFTRSYDKTSYGILKRGRGAHSRDPFNNQFSIAVQILWNSHVAASSWFSDCFGQRKVIHLKIKIKWKMSMMVIMISVWAHV